ncbi:hypothetical protein FACS1894137_14870 [Spirochaetia bacterium]|nr:hypothetical protein FACS1894137_14870 [Spirochaetia bacterium]
MSIAKGVVGRPVLSIIVFSLVSIVALYLTPKLAVGMFPEIDLPYLMVSTSYPGADPETVEKTLTKPLESALVNVSGLKKMQSTSQEHASIIMLEFDFGSNLDAKMNRMRENIDLVRSDLPANAQTPVVMAFDPLSAPVLRIALHGEKEKQGRRKVALIVIRVAAAGIGLGLIIFNIDKCGVVRYGRVIIALLGIQVTPVAIGLETGRVKSDGRGLVGQGRLVLIPVGIYKAAAYIRPDVLGVLGDCQIQVGQGQVVLLGLAIHDTPAAMDMGNGRRKLQRPGVVRYGHGEIALFFIEGGAAGIALGGSGETFY